jgi:WD40 repeat protein
MMKVFEVNENDQSLKEK